MGRGPAGEACQVRAGPGKPHPGMTSTSSFRIDRDFATLIRTGTGPRRGSTRAVSADACRLNLRGRAPASAAEDLDQEIIDFASKSDRPVGSSYNATAGLTTLGDPEDRPKLRGGACRSMTSRTLTRVTRASGGWPGKDTAEPMALTRQFRGHLARTGLGRAPAGAFDDFHRPPRAVTPVRFPPVSDTRRPVGDAELPFRTGHQHHATRLQRTIVSRRQAGHRTPLDRRRARVGRDLDEEMARAVHDPAIDGRRTKPFGQAWRAGQHPPATAATEGRPGRGGGSPRRDDGYSSVDTLSCLSRPSRPCVLPHRDRRPADHPGPRSAPGARRSIRSDHTRYGIRPGTVDRSVPDPVERRAVRRRSGSAASPGSRSEVSTRRVPELDR